MENRPAEFTRNNPKIKQTFLLLGMDTGFQNQNGQITMNKK